MQLHRPGGMGAVLRVQCLDQCRGYRRDPNPHQPTGGAPRIALLRPDAVRLDFVSFFTIMSKIDARRDYTGISSSLKYVSTDSSTDHRMASAVVLPIPGTSVRAGTCAKITASTLPKWSSRRLARSGPIPGSPCNVGLGPELASWAPPPSR